MYIFIIGLYLIYPKMDCVTQEYGVIEKTIKILIQDGESFKKVLTKHFRIKSILSWVGLKFYETEKNISVSWKRYLYFVRNVDCLVFIRNTQINDKTIWNGQIICFRSSEDKNHKFFWVKKIQAANYRNCIEICNVNKKIISKFSI